MSILRLQLEIPRDTALSEDRTVNTFHVDVATIPTDWTAITAALLKFYNTAGVGRTSSIASKLASVANSPARLKVYSFLDAEPRVPILETDMALGPYGSGALPEEVAICLSYKAESGSGLNPKRRQGRIYIGPLDTGVITTASGRTRLNVSTMDDILKPAQRLLSEWDAAGATWGVYSRVDNALYPITQFIVDDALDTQRRRGPARTARRTVFAGGEPVSLPVN